MLLVVAVVAIIVAIVLVTINNKICRAKQKRLSAGQVDPAALALPETAAVAFPLDATKQTREEKTVSETLKEKEKKPKLLDEKWT